MSQPPISHNRLAQRLGAAAASALLLVSAPLRAEGLPELGDASRAEFTPQMERRLGESIMNEIRLHEPSYVDDPEINDYLILLGRRLAAAGPEAALPLDFFAVRDGAINAFAMLGGHVGVNTGTLLAAQSESELAGVIAHEIAHVAQHHLARQMQQQKQMSMASLAAMAVAVLAARSNAQVANAAIASTTAASIQGQLAFSREFEREADRVGFELLEKAGFDPRGMGDFFGRLQRASRAYENNAPVYMRSHPLTVERLSDMENRVQSVRYRQVPDSLAFHLVRAKLRAAQGTPQEAVADFSGLLQARKYAVETAALYGLARAHLRARQPEAAAAALQRMDALEDTGSALFESLRAEILLARNDAQGAARVYAQALQRYPRTRALIYGRAEALQAARTYSEAQSFLEDALLERPEDARLHGLLARNFAAQGRRSAQHRAQAEMYFLQGRLLPAVEQLELAQKIGDAGFHELSGIDARLRELKKRWQEQERERRKQGQGG